MKRWFCLFVRNGSENIIFEKLKLLLGDNDKYYPFIPTVEQIFWLKGKPIIQQAPLFASYILVETEQDAETVRVDFLPLIERLGEDVYRILSYGRDENIMVLDSERKKWAALFDENYCITRSEAQMEGETIKITSGPFVGKEAFLKEFDKRRRKAVFQIDFAGDMTYIRTTLEIAKPRTKKEEMPNGGTEDGVKN